MIAARRLAPIRVEPAPKRGGDQLNYRDAARLAAELSRFIASGIPLEEGARLAAEAQDSVAARRALGHAASRLSAGAGPGEAFNNFGGAPGQALSAIIRAGERAGRLADALGAAAPLFSATAKFRERIVSLLIYPAVVGLTAIGVLTVFLLVVIPSLRPVLEDLGDAMPAGARVLLSVSDAAPFVLATVLLAVLAGILLVQVPSFRETLDRWRDRFVMSPVGLGIAASIETALFARIFAALLKAGTPVGDAIEDASAAVSNSILREKLSFAAGVVRQGGELSGALSGALGERNLIVQAGRLGNRGGGFAELVSDAGLSLSERAEIRLERLAAIAGPMIIIVLGSMIGLFVITLFSSLASLPDAAVR